MVFTNLGYKADVNQIPLSEYPHVAVVILNWNGQADTEACLLSLRRVIYPNLQVVVVDNGSTDDSVSRLRARFPEFPIYPTGTNLGFAEGNNFGVHHIKEADYILLLNNDTEMDPKCIEELVRVAQSDSRIGIVGPKIYKTGDERRIWSAGISICAGSALRVCVPQASPVSIGTGEIDQGQYDTCREVDAIVGCALMIRYDLWQELGGLDESLFMIHEDVDLCLRARQRGCRSVYVPTSMVWHKVSQSMKKVRFAEGGKTDIYLTNPLCTYYWYRNWLMVVKRHYGWRAFSLVLFAYLTLVFPRNLLRLSHHKTLSWRMISVFFYVIVDACLGRTPRRFVPR